MHDSAVATPPARPDWSTHEPWDSVATAIARAPKAAQLRTGWSMVGLRVSFSGGPVVGFIDIRTSSAVPPSRSGTLRSDEAAGQRAHRTIACRHLVGMWQ